MRTFPKSLLKAIKKDSVTKFKEAIKPHHLTKADQTGMWLIHHAAQHGSLNILKHLHGLGVSLERRTSIRSKSQRWRYSDLYLAAESGHLAVADWLIHMNCAFDPQKLLDIALRRGNLSAVKWALQQGGKLDYSNNPEKNSLYIATNYNCVDIMTWLIEEQKFIVDAAFIVPALRWVSFKTIRWLIDKNILIPPDELLHQALARGDALDVEWSIKRGGILDRSDDSKKNSLYIAIYRDNLAVAKWLVDENQFELDTTFLSSAFHSHLSDDMLKWLLDTKRIPLRIVLQSDYPLLAAVYRNSRTLFTWFHVEKGFSVEEKHNNHTNLLLHAIEGGSVLMAKHIVDNNFISLDSFSNASSNPILSASRKSLDCLKWLVEEKQQSLNVEDGRGRGPIITAIFCHNLKTLRYLHKKGLSLNVKSTRGTHSTHYAAIIDDVKILSWLIKKGCRLDEVNNNNENILHFNLQFYDNYHDFDVTRWLIEKQDILSFKMFRLTLFDLAYRLDDSIFDEYYPVLLEKIIENDEVPDYLTAIVRHLQRANRNWELSEFYAHKITLNYHVQFLMRHHQINAAVELLHRIIQDPIISDAFKSIAKINMAEILLLGIVYLSEDDSPLATTDPWLTHHNFYYLRMIQIKYILKDVTHPDAAVIKEKVGCVLSEVSLAQQNILSKPSYFQKSEEYYSAYLNFKASSFITRLKIYEIDVDNAQNNATSFTKSLMFWQEKSESTSHSQSQPALIINTERKLNNLLTFWRNPAPAAPVSAAALAPQTSQP